MQRMQMRMKLPLKHDICQAKHFEKMDSEHCQASEVELFVKTVNDLEPLKYPPWVFVGSSEYASTFPQLYI